MWLTTANTFKLEAEVAVVASDQQAIALLRDGSSVRELGCRGLVSGRVEEPVQ